MLYCMSYSRLIFGSALLGGVRPKAALLLGPISQSWAMPSPFVDRLANAGSQFEVPGMRAQSFQLRMSDCRFPAAYVLAKVCVQCRTYLPTLALRAVLPS